MVVGNSLLRILIWISLVTASLCVSSGDNPEVVGVMDPDEPEANSMPRKASRRNNQTDAKGWRKPKRKQDENRSSGLLQPPRERVVGLSPAADAFAARQALKTYWAEKAVRDNTTATAVPESPPDANRTLDDRNPSEPAQPPPAVAALQAPQATNLVEINEHSTANETTFEDKQATTGSALAELESDRNVKVQESGPPAHLAATKVQSVFRGHQVRQALYSIKLRLRATLGPPQSGNKDEMSVYIAARVTELQSRGNLGQPKLKHSFLGDSDLYVARSERIWRRMMSKNGLGRQADPAALQQELHKKYGSLKFRLQALQKKRAVVEEGPWEFEKEKVLLEHFGLIVDETKFDRPSQYGSSRNLGIELVEKIGGLKKLAKILGLGGPSVQLVIPGIPPTSTASPAIKELEDYGACLGNQDGDMGLHVTLSAEDFPKADAHVIVDYVNSIMSKPLGSHLQRTPDIESILDLSDVFLLEAGQWNDFPVGAQWYVGADLPVSLRAAANQHLTNHWQSFVKGKGLPLTLQTFPERILIDDSHQLHISLVGAAPAWLDHPKGEHRDRVITRNVLNPAEKQFNTVLVMDPTYGYAGYYFFRNAFDYGSTNAAQHDFGWHGNELTGNAFKEWATTWFKGKGCDIIGMLGLKPTVRQAGYEPTQCTKPTNQYNSTDETVCLPTLVKERRIGDMNIWNGPYAPKAFRNAIIEQKTAETWSGTIPFSKKANHACSGWTDGCTPANTGFSRIQMGELPDTFKAQGLLLIAILEVISPVCMKQAIGTPGSISKLKIKEKLDIWHATTDKKKMHFAVAGMSPEVKKEAFLLAFAELSEMPDGNLELAKTRVADYVKASEFKNYVPVSEEQGQKMLVEGRRLWNDQRQKAHAVCAEEEEEEEGACQKALADEQNAAEASKKVRPEAPERPLQEGEQKETDIVERRKDQDSTAIRALPLAALLAIAALAL